MEDRLIEVLPASFTVLSWNADHFWGRDLPRRQVKMEGLLKWAVNCKADVIFLQQTGIMPAVAKETMFKKGWRTHISNGPGGTAGVAILVRLAIQSKFKFPQTVALEGHVICLQSTAGCRFALVNT